MEAPDLFSTVNIESNSLIRRLNWINSKEKIYYFTWLAVNNYEKLLTYPDDELKKIVDRNVGEGKNILYILFEYYIPQIIYRNVPYDWANNRLMDLYILTDSKFDILKKLIRKLIDLGASLLCEPRYGENLFDLFIDYSYTNSILSRKKRPHYINYIVRDEFFDTIFRAHYHDGRIDIEDYKFDPDSSINDPSSFADVFVMKKIAEIKNEDLRKTIAEKDAIIAEKNAIIVEKDATIADMEFELGFVPGKGKYYKNAESDFKAKSIL